MSTSKKAVILVGILVVAGAAGAAGLALSRRGGAETPPQPVRFSHKSHVGRGLECLDCHRGAEQGARAGIPAVGLAGPPEDPPGDRLFSHKKHVGDESLECASCHTKAAKGDEAGMPANLKKCMSCHETVDESRPAERKLAALLGEKPEWTRATSIPSEVRFSHKAHVDKEIACSTCHVGIEKSEAVSTALRVSMASCMACHEEKKAPTDCRSCHEALDPRARITCMHCHETPRGKDPEEGKLRDYAARGAAIPWEQANRLPGHVLFSHAAHVRYGKMNCAECHGDMKQVDAPVTRSQVDHLTMKRCMECHAEKGASNDCLRCHK